MAGLRQEQGTAAGYQNTKVHSSGGGNAGQSIYAQLGMTPEEQAACQRLLLGKGTNADMKTMARFNDEELVQLGFKPNGRMITMRHDPRYNGLGWVIDRPVVYKNAANDVPKNNVTPSSNVAVNQANSIDNQAAMVQNAKDKNAEIASEQVARPAETITARLDAFEARLQKLEAGLQKLEAALGNTGTTNSNSNIPPQLPRDSQGNIISGVTQ